MIYLKAVLKNINSLLFKNFKNHENKEKNEKSIEFLHILFLWREGALFGENILYIMDSNL